MDTAAAIVARRFPGLMERLLPLACPGEVLTECVRWPAPVVPSPSGPVRLCGARNPLREADVDLVRRGVAGSRVLCLGLDGGYVLKALLDRPEVRSLVAVPLLREAFAWFLARNPFAAEIAADPRLTLAPPDFDALAAYADFSIHVARREAACVPSEGLRDRLLNMANQAEVRAELGDLPERNEAANLAPGARPWRDVAELRGACAGRPCLAAGAGPSLDAWLPLLARRRPEVVLLAASTAVRKLVAAGACPDFVAFLEPNDMPLRHLEGAWRACRCPLVAYTHSCARAVARYEGPVYLAENEEARDRRGLGLLWSKGNVSHMLASLAVHLGAGEVALAGFDFGFPSGRFYGEGVPVEKRLGLAAREMEVPAVGGGTVATSVVFNIARRFLEGYIRRCAGLRPPVPFFAIGQSGARVEGAARLGQAEAASRYFLAHPPPGAG